MKPIYEKSDDDKLKTAQMILDGLIDGSYTSEALLLDWFTQGAIVGLAVGRIRRLNRDLEG